MFIKLQNFMRLIDMEQVFPKNNHSERNKVLLIARN